MKLQIKEFTIEKQSLFPSFLLYVLLLVSQIRAKHQNNPSCLSYAMTPRIVWQMSIIAESTKIIPDFAQTLWNQESAWAGRTLDRELPTNVHTLIFQHTADGLLCVDKALLITAQRTCIYNGCYIFSLFRAMYLAIRDG